MRAKGVMHDDCGRISISVVMVYGKGEKVTETLKSVVPGQGAHISLCSVRERRNQGFQCTHSCNSITFRSKVEDNWAIFRMGTSV